MKSLLIFALCVTAALAMPQRFPTQQFPDDNNIFYPGNINGNFGNGNSVTTTTAPSTTAATPAAPTTASPQFLACMMSCPTTTEYNPVCGTDNINYPNNGHLSCAQRCGKNVAAVRSGICTA